MSKIEFAGGPLDGDEISAIRPPEQLVIVFADRAYRYECDRDDVYPDHTVHRMVLAEDPEDFDEDLLAALDAL